MSVLTVQTGWIVGTPDSASHLVTQIVAWVVQNTPWVPDSKALEDIESLRKEMMEAYEIPGEGYCAFATQIVDGTLNRLYPYLIQVSRDSGVRIESSREKTKDEDENPVVKYTINTTYGEDQPEDDQGNPLPNIEGNPFPLPNEIDPTTVLPIAGSPTPVYSPVYPGVPYNPLDPLSREPNPYPAREDQPNIPYVPGETSVPGSPIYERPAYEGGGTEYGVILDQLPRADEISLEGVTPGEEPEEPEEPEQPGEGEEPEEPEEPEKEVPDELISLLKRILYEIENQGSLTRNALAESVVSILSGLATQTTALQQGIDSSEALLGKVITNTGEAEQALLKEILSELQESQEEPEKVEDSLLGVLGESLDEIGEWIKDGLNAVRNAVDSGLDQVGTALTSIGGILESGFDAITEAVSNSLTALKESITSGNKAVMDWLGTAFEFNPEDFSKYLCAFLTEIEKCKDCNYLQTNKEG